MNVQFGTYIYSGWGGYARTAEDDWKVSQMMKMCGGCTPYETFKLERASVATYIDIKFDLLHATS